MADRLVQPKNADAPTDLTLDQEGSRGLVYFPHPIHVEAVDGESGHENCRTCHHTMTSDGETPVACRDCHKLETTAIAPDRKAAFHGSCQACHKDLGVEPTTVRRRLEEAIKWFAERWDKLS